MSDFLCWTCVFFLIFYPRLNVCWLCLWMKGLPSNQLIRAALRPVVMSVGAGDGEECVCVHAWVCVCERERGRQANRHQSSASSHTVHVLHCFSRPPLRNPAQPSHPVRVRVHVRVRASINKVGVCIQDPDGEYVRHCNTGGSRWSCGCVGVASASSASAEARARERHTR